MPRLEDMSIEFAIPGSGKTTTTKDLLYIDETDLSAEFAAQSALYAFFSVLCSQARYERDEAKRLMELEQAQAFVEFKNDPELVPTGGRTVSDDLANKYVEMDEQYAASKKRYTQLEQEFRFLESIQRALEMRANMLISLGAQMRSEADMSDMHINEENPGDAIRKSIRSRRS